MIGCNHHDVPLEIREKFAICATAEDRIYEDLKSLMLVKEVLILNTCNRVEIYFVTEQEDVLDRINQVICEAVGIDKRTFEAHFKNKKGKQVIQHLFEVASGINSQIVGETEIFGQVKEALEIASEKKSVGPILNRIFQKGFQAAKWVRTYTKIGEGQISIGNIAAELASRIYGNLKSTSILIVGSGEVGEKTLQAFISHGANNLTMTNRTYEKARILSEKLGGRVVHFEKFLDTLHFHDIVICSTGAPSVILDANTTQEVVSKRHHSPMLFIDLSVPRNIAQEVSFLGNTYLYNLDDLSKIANENMGMRKAEVIRCIESLSRKVEYVWEQITNRKLIEIGKVTVRI